MVGDTGIEPVTPSMSTKCSTAELITRLFEEAEQNRSSVDWWAVDSVFHDGVQGGFLEFRLTPILLLKERPFPCPDPRSS